MNVYPRKCSTLPAFPGNDYKSQCVVDMLYAVGDDDAAHRLERHLCVAFLIYLDGLFYRGEWLCAVLLGGGISVVRHLATCKHW